MVSSAHRNSLPELTGFREKIISIRLVRAGRAATLAPKQGPPSGEVVVPPGGGPTCTIELAKK
jgi:hypothetical protein